MLWMGLRGWYSRLVTGWSGRKAILDDLCSRTLSLLIPAVGALTWSVFESLRKMSAIVPVVAALSTMLIMSHLVRNRAQVRVLGRAKCERVQVRFNELIAEGERLLERSLDFETVESEAIAWFRTVLSFLKVIGHDDTLVDYSPDIFSQFYRTGTDQWLGVKEAVGHLRNVAACFKDDGNEQIACSHTIAVAA